VRLRIVSDGSAQGTTVVNADTDEDLTSNVKLIRWVHEMGRLPQIEITFARLDVELRSETEL
jgi:hypothetical protein